MGTILNRRRVCSGKKGLLPSGYIQLKYIDTGDGAYIDTGVSASGTSGEFEMNFSCDDFLIGKFICGQGRNANQGNSLGAVISNYGILSVQYQGPATDTGIVLSEDVWYKLELKEYKFLLDGNVLLNVEGSLDLWFTFCFGARGAYSAKNIKIGVCTFLDSFYLIPALRISDNVAGMYNLKNGTFMISSNTDIPFIAGPRV